MNKKTPRNTQNLVDGCNYLKYLKAIEQNVTYESTYNRECQRDLLNAAMVLNGPAS